MTNENDIIGNHSDSQDDLADLRAFGITEETLILAKAGRPVSGCANDGHRQVQIKSICELANEIIAEYEGVVMFCAATVLACLVKRGFGKTAKGQIIHNPSCIGDALGRHGLNLPCIRKQGKLRYALSMVDAPEEEKAAAQERLNNLSAIQKKALPFA
jgi:hypothetical protein